MRHPIPSQRAIPDILNGYELDNANGWFSVIIPEASVNLCQNPSFETATTGWSAGAGTLSRVATYQRFGTYSAKYQPTAAVNDGLFYGTPAGFLISTTAGQWYTASFYIKGAGGAPFKAYFADFGGNQLGQAKTFNLGHDWTRFWVTWYETQTNSRRLYITKNNSTSVIPWYVDGVLIENKAYPTTYFDGDSVGYVVGQTDFYWNGARHASTSVRSAQTGAGGRPVKLKDLGFVLMAMIGLGMSPVNPIGQDYGWQDGALFQRVRKPSRDFTLAGYVSGATVQELKRNRAALEAAFSPDNLSTQQPLTLQYEFSDECGTSPGEVLTIPCVYNGGLPGQTDNLYAEKVALGFTMFLPLIQNSTQEGASPSYQTTLANIAYGAARISGQWGPLGTGFNAAVRSVKLDAARGRIWYGGDFTTANGITVNGITYWDIALQQFVALGGATKGVAGPTSVAGIAIDANGNAWIFGYYTTCGGAATKGICRWNNATNTFTAYNLAGTVTSFRGGAFDSNGLLYAWGDFLNWNGDAAQDYITSFTAAGSWVAVGVSPYAANEFPRTGNCGKVDAANNLYLGSQGSGVAGHLRKWNATTSAWSDLASTSVNGTIMAIYIAPDSNIYLGGIYTTLAGLAIVNIAKYNLTTFTPMGSGLTGTYGVADLTSDERGQILAKGIFLIPGYPSANGFLAFWNNSTWIVSDLVTQEVNNAGGGVVVYQSNIYLGWFEEAGSGGTSSLVTALTNSGSEVVFPIITITGPGTVYQIKNETTGDLLSFNLVLLDGEVVVLNISQNNIAFQSSTRGNILGTIMPGTNYAGFRLLPGANRISVFIYTPTSANTAIDFRWTPQYLGLEH